MNWVGVAQIPVESFQHVSLSLENFGLGVRRIRAHQEMRDRRRHDLLEFRCNEHAGEADQLPVKLNAGREEWTNDVDTEERDLG